MKKLKAKTDTRAGLGVPGRIYDIESKAQKANPQTIAENVLKKIATDLKINPDLSQLKFDQVKESVLGKHVLFQQQHAGKSISGAWVRVDIDNDGKVYNIQNDLVPEPVLRKTEKLVSKKSKTAGGQQLTEEEAKTAALAAVNLKPSANIKVVETELAYYSVDNVPTLSWKIVIHGKKPAAAWKIYVDALTGKILNQINLLKKANGTGRVFDPNPVAKLNNTNLTSKSKIPVTAYTEVVLKGVSKNGVLDGPYVSTQTTTKRIRKKDLKFLFKRENRAFKEVMVYYHIDKIQRYIQELGFKNVLNRAIKVNIDGSKEDNSFYDQVAKDLTFGQGDVHDAEDAEIIIHEYGHAIQDSQVPGFGPEGEARAMGEGFGDYLAASFFANIKPVELKLAIGSWDCISSTGAEPPCLRRLDSNKKYPKDMRGREHDDGEIWSACLWQIRTAIGGKAADKLVIAHHFLLKPTASFEDAAKALITADKNLNKGVNGKTITDIFVKRGILPNKKRNNKRAGIPFEEMGANHK